VNFFHETLLSTVPLSLFPLEKKTEEAERTEDIGKGLGLEEKLAAAHLATKHAKKESDGRDRWRSD
jgi:hypothetical protein